MITKEEYEEAVEYVAGVIYWAGEFMYNIGLAEKGLG